jgi:glycolate oxidase FAD binding subunit
MDIQRPSGAGELAALLADSNERGRTIQLGGAFTKNAMGGPVEPADVVVSTSRMTNVLQYEPGDLTISVEAGMPFGELSALLLRNRQMIPLDPIYFDSATVGGVVASNCSGPRRRLYGTARDLIIGMTFVTLEGKQVKSGGMVVKNVAGLDMAKLMIGSFGTLAAIASINFKLIPMPETAKTFFRLFDTAEEAIQFRDEVLASPLQPASIDLLNPVAAARLGLHRWSVLVEVGGNEAVIQRACKELNTAQALDHATETRVREFTPEFLKDYPGGAVARISCTLSQLRQLMLELRVPALARAGNGICYAYFKQAEEASLYGFRGAIEFAPETAKRSMTLWPGTGSDFALMTKIKEMFDPKHLLNRRRLYGRI